MDRQIVFNKQIPLETDLLNAERQVLIGLGFAAQDVLGANVLASGLPCIATTPPSLKVQVGAGRLYSLQNLDSTAFSTLAADTAHQLIKQGIVMDAIQLNCPAPVTAGYSVNYLIQAGYFDVDATPVVLPYYNAANPTVAWSGPNNTGAAQNTQRQGQISLIAKPGIAAPTGTQSTPSADTGYTGLYVVTVAFGQTAITSSNIATASGAPFITETLTQKISQATADARYLPLSVYSNLLTADGVNKPTAALAWSKPLTLNAPASTVALTLNSASGQDALDINLQQAAGVGWAINIAGSINTDVRGIQIINSSAGAAAGTVALVIGNNTGSELLIGKTGGNFAGAKFASGPAGEVSYVWSGGSVPLVFATGPGGGPTAWAAVNPDGVHGGFVVYAPASGQTALTANAVAGAQTFNAVAPNTTGQSFGINAIAGTNSSDWALALQNAAQTINLMKVRGDGSFILGWNNGTLGAANSLIGAATGAITVSAPTSGIALSVNGVASATSLQVFAPNSSGASFGLGIFGGTNSSDFAFVVANAAMNTNFMKISGDGSVKFQSIATTASAANAFLDNSNGNNLLRSTSSIRYKQDVRTLSADRAGQIIDSLRVVTYRSKAQADDPDRVHYGLIAEEVARLDASLVNLDEHGSPDGVQYDRIGVLLVAALQGLKQGLNHV